jgi:hypothetical protein
MAGARDDSDLTNLEKFDIAIRDKGVQDNQFIDGPTLKFMKEVQVPAKGLGFEKAIGTDFFEGTFYDPDTSPTFEVERKDVFQKASYTVPAWIMPVKLHRRDVAVNKSDPQANADFIAETMKAVLKSVDRFWARQIFTARNDTPTRTFNGETVQSAATAPWGLPDLISEADPTYTGEYLGNLPVAKVVDSDGAKRWTAYTQRETTPSAGVSVHLQRVAEVLRYFQVTLGEMPDLVVTTLDVWNALHLQTTKTGGYLAAPAGSADAKWGYSTIYVNSVPIVADRYCPGTSGSKNHHMYFLTKRGLTFRPYTEYAWKMHSQGWQSPAKEPEGIYNYYLLHAQMATFERRALAGLYNLDPANTAEPGAVNGTATINDPSVIPSDSGAYAQFDITELDSTTVQAPNTSWSDPDIDES